MNDCYGKGVQNCVLCWEVVPVSEGPLSEVPLNTVSWRIIIMQGSGILMVKFMDVLIT